MDPVRTLDFNYVYPGSSVSSDRDPAVGVFDFDFDALEPFQVKHYDSDDGTTGPHLPDRDDSDFPDSDPESETGPHDFPCRHGLRPVLAATLPPGSRPPCDVCGAPPVIVAGDRGLCGRCASQMMDAEAQGASDDSD